MLGWRLGESSAWRRTQPRMSPATSTGPRRTVRGCEPTCPVTAANACLRNWRTRRDRWSETATRVEADPAHHDLPLANSLVVPALPRLRERHSGILLEVSADQRMFESVAS